MSDEGFVVITVKTIHFPNPIDDSIIEHCVMCGQDVWLGKSTIESIGGRPYICQCNDCAKKNKIGNPTYKPLTENQRDLISEACGFTDEEMSEVEKVAHKRILGLEE